MDHYQKRTKEKIYYKIMKMFWALKRKVLARIISWLIN
jgi:hypothetical protein